jgi:hypothetical protein
MLFEADEITRRKAHLAARIYVAAGLYYVLILFFFCLHKAYPFLLEPLLEDGAGSDIDFRIYMLFILGLPIVVPILMMFITKAQEPYEIVMATIVLAFILGTTGALLTLNLDSNLVLVPVAAIALTFLITAMNCMIDPSHAFSRIMHVLMFIEAASLISTANSIMGVEWYIWVVGFIMFFLVLYLTLTPVEMGDLLQEPKSDELISSQLLSGLKTISMMSVVIFYPHAFATGGITILNSKRKWMGPEDKR